MYKHAYMNAVAQELGWERAIALYSDMAEGLGALQGKMIKEQAGIEDVDAETAHKLLKSVLDSLGMCSEVIEAGPQRVVSRPGRCPIYDSARMMGIDHETIEKLCRAGAIRSMAAMTRQLNPDLSYELRAFRASPDGSCIEEIVLR
jgi:hypothetical protein